MLVYGVKLMKSKIAIFGSCVSMDNFRSVHNQDYKENFELSAIQLRSSLISVMHEPIDFTEEEIKITPITPQNRFSTNVLRDDLQKSFFNNLNDKIEFLVLDLYFDLLFGVLYTNRGVITNNKWDYTQTDFYKNLKDVKEYSFKENPYEYYVLWTKYCDKFFNYLQENYPNLKIILNKINIVDKVKNKNGDYYIEPLFTKRVVKLKPLLELIEGYLISNYDIILLDLTRNVTSDENHIWGKSLVHYNIEYYNNFYKVMLELTNGNNNKFFYEENNEIHQKEEIPNEYKNYKYKIRNIRNSHKKIDDTMTKIKKLIH